MSETKKDFLKGGGGVETKLHLNLLMQSYYLFSESVTSLNSL
jgi:hypothetical protein